MTRIEIRRGALFLAGSIVAGLALAYLAVLLWPGLLNRDLPAAQVPVDVHPEVMQAMGPIVPVGSTATQNVDGSASAPFGPGDQTGLPLVASYAPAVRASAPAVVNIFAERKVTERLPPSGLEQLFPARGWLIRQRHSRNHSRASVRQGRDVCLHHS